MSYLQLHDLTFFFSLSLFVSRVVLLLFFCSFRAMLYIQEAVRFISCISKIDSFWFETFPRTSHIGVRMSKINNRMRAMLSMKCQSSFGLYNYDWVNLFLWMFHLFLQRIATKNIRTWQQEVKLEKCYVHNCLCQETKATGIADSR